jgi:hypothetical protein
MSRITRANRITKIVELLKIVKLSIHLKEVNGKVGWVIYKSNRIKDKPYYYIEPTINFTDIFKKSNKFESNYAHYACHEIAHYAVASKQRRIKKDYNLHKKSKKFAAYEECKVLCINNYLLMKFLYIKWRDPFFNMGEYIKGNEAKLEKWWVAEGNTIAKTYADLVSI